MPCHAGGQQGDDNVTNVHHGVGDFTLEKLQKMVKKAAKREKSRYEKDLARAAKIAHMDVDELRGGSS